MTNKPTPGARRNTPAVMPTPQALAAAWAYDRNIEHLARRVAAEGPALAGRLPAGQRIELAWYELTRTAAEAAGIDTSEKD